MGKHKKIQWGDVPLGQKSDEELSRELGVSRTTVCRNRQKRGIPPHRWTPSGIHWDDERLGQRPDREIAKEKGVTAQAVIQARVRRGIPSYGSKPKP